MINTFPSIKKWLDASENEAARITVTDTQQLDVSNSFSNVDPLLFPGYQSENRKAYEDFFNSLHANSSGPESAGVLDLMNTDYQAGNHLTSAMVKKAIHLACPFDIYWAGLATDPDSFLSNTKVGKKTLMAFNPRTEEGRKLIDKFNARVKERFLQANAQTSVEELGVLETIKKEIQTSQFTSPRTSGKLESLINIAIYRITFALKVNELKTPYLSLMKKPAEECWNLLMDSPQSINIYNFDNEQGYMAAMLNGLNKMIGTLDCPLDEELFCTLHDVAVEGVYNGAFTLLPKNFRDFSQVAFLLTNRSNSTKVGCDEFLMSSKTEWSHIEGNYLVCRYSLKLIREACVRQLNELAGASSSTTGELNRVIQCIDTYYQELEVALKIEKPADRKEVVTACRKKCDKVINKSKLILEIKAEIIQQECKKKAAEIIATYHQEHELVLKLTEGELRETAILTCIAKCCQDLFQHHLFADGNTRTIVFLVMNKLLLQNGLSPTIFYNPNAIAMHSLAEIVELMRGGQGVFGYLL